MRQAEINFKSKANPERVRKMFEKISARGARLSSFTQIEKYLAVLIGRRGAWVVADTFFAYRLGLYSQYISDLVELGVKIERGPDPRPGTNTFRYRLPAEEIPEAIT